MSPSTDTGADPQGASVEEIVALLKRLIAELQPGIAPESVQEDVPLVEGGLDLDSVAVIELITDMERRLGFEFLETDLRMRTFRSLTTLAEVIVLRLRCRERTG